MRSCRLANSERGMASIPTEKVRKLSVKRKLDARADFSTGDRVIDPLYVAAGAGALVAFLLYVLLSS